MKIKVQIDSVFQEEMLQIQAPSRTPKIQQVVELLIFRLILTWPMSMFTQQSRKYVSLKKKSSWPLSAQPLLKALESRI